MMNVFISHGFAHDDEQGTDFLDRLYRALDFPSENLIPFIDKKRLEPGYIWRNELHEALARCGAGIIVLSERSIGRDWVKKEAAILSWRRALQVAPGFRLHVVILDEIGEESLDREGLGPMQLTEIQALRCRWDDADIDRVVNALHDDLLTLARSVLRRIDWTPLDKLREFLAMRLVGIPQADKLRELAQDIDDSNEKLQKDHVTVNDCAECIACALLRNCFGKTGHLDGFMARLFQLGVLLEYRQDIFDAVSSLWVDPQCAAVFHPRLDPKRLDRTAFIETRTEGASLALYETTMLAKRANPELKRLKVICIACPANPEELSQNIARKVVEEVGTKLLDECSGDHAHNAEVMHQLSQLDYPIFVLMKFPVDEQQLEELLDELPGFLYIGMHSDRPVRRGEFKWRSVEPTLDKEELMKRRSEYASIKGKYHFA